MIFLLGYFVLLLRINAENSKVRAAFMTIQDSKIITRAESLFRISWANSMITCAEDCLSDTNCCEANFDQMSKLCYIEISGCCNSTREPMTNWRVIQQVDGLPQIWSPWELCAVSCGGGSRTRTQNSPNGQACSNANTELEECNTFTCALEAFSCDGQPDGNYKDVNDCAQYFVCTNCILYHIDCGAGTVYNAAKLYCDWPDNVNC